MVVQLRKNGNEFTFVLPPQGEQELGLVDGSAVEIRRADLPSSAFRYASADEMMEAHRKVESRYADAYRELAK